MLFIFELKEESSQNNLILESKRAASSGKAPPKPQGKQHQFRKALQPIRARWARNNIPRTKCTSCSQNGSMKEEGTKETKELARNSLSASSHSIAALYLWLLSRYTTWLDSALDHMFAFHDSLPCAKNVEMKSNTEKCLQQICKCIWVCWSVIIHAPPPASRIALKTSKEL
jgi:hypothetical protein